MPLPRRYPITASNAAGTVAAPTAFSFGGELTDGLGDGGQIAASKTVTAVLHGGQATQQIELVLQALWLGEGDSVRITNETDPSVPIPLVTLSGTDLPPISEHARSFTAGRIRVTATLSTNSSFFSMGIHTKCMNGALF